MTTIVLFFVVVGMQIHSGAFQSEFGGHSDEAAHYVTGLMVHDYLTQPLFKDPFAFAREFYDHYPKVAIGHWPPVFYLIQAGWMSVIGEGRTSLLLLMALVSALFASSVYVLAAEVHGWMVGLFLGLLQAALPVVQWSSTMIMADVLVALGMLWACRYYAKFLETGDQRWAIAFGLVASLSILTKMNALALAFVPPLAVTLTGKLSLVRLRSFWIPVVIVAMVCGPWCWIAREWLFTGLDSEGPNPGFTRAAVGYFPWAMVRIVGWSLLVPAIVGISAAFLHRPEDRSDQSGRRTLAALIIGVLALQCLVPVSLEERYLIGLTPALLIFAADGVRSIASSLKFNVNSPRLRIAMIALLAIGFYSETFALSSKQCSGYSTVAETIIEDSRSFGKVLLISADELGDGMFVSEIAMREQRTGHVVLRASKVLASSDWIGRNYRLTYKTMDEASAFLSHYVDVIVIDTSLPRSWRTEDSRQLEEVLHSSPESWESAGFYPRLRQGKQIPDVIQVFRNRKKRQ